MENDAYVNPLELSRKASVPHHLGSPLVQLPPPALHPSWYRIIKKRLRISICALAQTHQNLFLLLRRNFLGKLFITNSIFTTRTMASFSLFQMTLLRANFFGTCREPLLLSVGYFQKGIKAYTYLLRKILSNKLNKTGHCSFNDLLIQFSLGCWLS